MMKKIMMGKQKTKVAVIICSMLFLFLCMYGIKANAMDVASYTYEGVTYTGSITYYGVSGPSGYYELALRANQVTNQLFESITLKNGAGTNKPAITALTRNSRTALAQTPVFAGNVYTMKGYYYYVVTSSTGMEYTFSVTR